MARSWLIRNEVTVTDGVKRTTVFLFGSFIDVWYEVN